MISKRVTLRDIAQRANVSVATVSCALNGKGRISPAKRQRIQGMLKRAGYRPRVKARPVLYLAFAAQRVKTHVFIPFMRKYQGINEALHAEGVDLHVEFTNARMPLEAQLAGMLSYKPAAVVLDSDLGDAADSMVGFFEANSVPVVQVGHVPHSHHCGAVVVDNFNGARTAVQHLAHVGHTRIGTIRWNVDGDPASQEKYAGYLCALGEAGLEARPEYVVESPYKREAGDLPGRVAVGRLLSLPEPPTAVFVENSFVSPSLLYPSGPTEKSLPPEIRALDMVHFEAWHLDGQEEAVAGALAFPGRATKLLRIDWHELGRVAALRVLERLNGANGANGDGQVLRIAPRLMMVNGEQSTPLPLAAGTALRRKEQS